MFSDAYKNVHLMHVYKINKYPDAYKKACLGEGLIEIITIVKNILRI